MSEQMVTIGPRVSQDARTTTLNSLKLMGVSGRLSRLSRTSGIMSSNKSLADAISEISKLSAFSGSKKSALAPAMPSIQQENSREMMDGSSKSCMDAVDDSSKSSKEVIDVSDAQVLEEELETLQMLADSYREMTGRAMPLDMTVEQAYAELRVLTMKAWQDSEDSAAADADIDTSAVTSTPAGADGSSRADEKINVADKFRRGVSKAKLQLRVFGSLKVLHADDWGNDMVAPLNASYHSSNSRLFSLPVCPLLTAWRVCATVCLCRVAGRATQGLLSRGHWPCDATGHVHRASGARDAPTCDAGVAG